MLSRAKDIAGDSIESTNAPQLQENPHVGSTALSEVESIPTYFCFLNPILGISLDAMKVSGIRSQRIINKIIKSQLLQLLTFGCEGRKMLLLVENLDRSVFDRLPKAT